MGINAYEEARKQTIQENKKKLEEFGLSKIAQSIAELSKSEKKTKQRKQIGKPKEIVEPRRSSRARNTVTYRDDLDIGLLETRRPRKTSASLGSYLARPLEEVRLCTYEERVQAMKAAERLQSNLKSENPSFVKSMVRSHVYSCFWLGLPNDFCKAHLKSSVSRLDMVLENESGREFDAIYIRDRVGLSGGWRAFALEHKLDDGDALVFELVESTRFKIYITKVSSSQQPDVDEPNKKETNAKGSQKQKKTQQSQPQSTKVSSSQQSSVDEPNKKVSGGRASRTQKRTQQPQAHSTPYKLRKLS